MGVPGTVLHTGDTAVNQQNPSLLGSDIPVREVDMREGRQIINKWTKKETISNSGKYFKQKQCVLLARSWAPGLQQALGKAFLRSEYLI